MGERRVLLLSVISFLIIIVGLGVLSLPDTFEGGVLYTLDQSHSVRSLDLVGLMLVALGGALAWGAGLLWQRGMTK